MQLKMVLVLLKENFYSRDNLRYLWEKGIIYYSTALPRMLAEVSMVNQN